MHPLCLPAGFAAELARNYGEMMAKHFLGHKPNSVFALAGAKKRVSLPLDLAIPLLASLLDRGALPFKNVEELLSTGLVRFGVLPAFEDQPVFLSRDSLERLSQNSPLSLGAAKQQTCGSRAS